MKGYTYPGKAPFKKEDKEDVKDKPSGNEFFDMGRASGRVVTKSNFGDAVRASKIADKKNTTKIKKYKPSTTNSPDEVNKAVEKITGSKKGTEEVIGLGSIGKNPFSVNKIPKEKSIGKIK